TWHVSADKRTSWPVGRAAEAYVLKACHSSGMKGTIFADDPRFASELTAAQSSKKGPYILQGLVEPVTHRLHYFGDDGVEVSDGWCYRVVAHLALEADPGRGVADITVTARRDRSVHGAKDCIQIGSILTE